MSAASEEAAAVTAGPFGFSAQQRGGWPLSDWGRATDNVGREGCSGDGDGVCIGPPRVSMAMAFL